MVRGHSRETTRRMGGQIQTFFGQIYTFVELMETKKISIVNKAWPQMVL